MSTINDTDIILVNRGGTDYQTTAAELKEYVNFVPPMPWEGHDGGIFHVKNATAEVKLDVGHNAWDIDGTNERLINAIQPGEEVVFVTEQEASAIFRGNTGNWEFGELTDVSKVEFFVKMFAQCYEFNADISDWNTSNAINMSRMFVEARKFNQDLSKWCVSNVIDYRAFGDDASSWEDKNKPVWGTCPRGEDQP